MIEFNHYAEDGASRHFFHGLIFAKDSINCTWNYYSVEIVRHVKRICMLSQVVIRFDLSANSGLVGCLNLKIIEILVC